ncbi:MAG: polymer-forming cytoskeletal protein [Gammaproteobacteria bacterium]|jgi:cytoskeletal protein CcmA (bactofilin family)|nr:polymer-forming cytoskeletal protein [Gammaproteobacteria bacterium]
MLGNKKSLISVSGKTTLVSTDTVILGDIRFSGVLDIEGLVQGNIIAEPGKEALVRVVDKGRVEGEIRSPSVVINGSVQGNVYATKHLELAARARVEGNVFYVLVEMAAGAEVNGSLSHIADPDAARAAQGEPATPRAAAPAKLD